MLALPPLPQRSSSSSSSEASEASDDEEEDGQDGRSTAMETDDPQPRTVAAESKARENTTTLTINTTTISSSSQDHSKSAQPTTKAKERHKRPRQGFERAQRENDQGYSLLLSTTLDRRPMIVRREDGFEKRWLWRCGRCRVVIGYQLDQIHYTTSPETTTGAGKTGAVDSQDGGVATDAAGVGDNAVSSVDVQGGTGAEGQKKEHDKIVYLLPGGLISTQDMTSGKTLAEEDVEIRF